MKKGKSMTEYNLVPSNTEKTFRYYNCVFFLIAVVLFILYGTYHRVIEISSDTTTTLPMSEDLLNGNILLHNWILGSNNFYFTEIVVYAFGKMFGISNSVLLGWIPGLFFVIMLVGIIVLFDVAKYAPKKCFVFVIVFVGIVGMIPYCSSYTLLNANSHNNLYAFIVLNLILLKLYFNSGKKYFVFISLIITALLGYSESVSHMVYTAPMICCCVVYWVRQRDRKIAIVGITTFFAVALEKIIYYIFNVFCGLETLGYPVHLSAASDIPARVIGWIKMFAILLGEENYLDSPITLQKVTVTFLILVLFFSLIYLIIKLKDYSWVPVYSLFVVLWNSAACVFSDVPIHYRYIVPSFIFGYAITALVIADITECKKKHGSRIFIIICIICIILNSAYNVYQITKAEEFGSDQKEVVKCINNNGLGNGYGDFWVSSVVSYYSDYSIHIYPITAEENFLKPYRELINKKWYDEKEMHYIVVYKENERNGFVNKKDAIEICGKPDKIFDESEYYILYWENDISKYCIKG